MTPLESQLDRLAAAPRLLVASDFDGVIAPIVAEPSAAVALPGALEALTTLARQPQTEVAVVSGRALASLRPLMDGISGVILVGSHGAEVAGMSPIEDARILALVDRIEAESRRIAERTGPGLLVERKPVGVAFHFRQASSSDADRAVEELLAGPARWPGVRVRHGKMVVELFVVDASKADAVSAIRHRQGCTGVVFLGDDRTDEDVFATLTPTDLGVKVGADEDGHSTAAAFRVADPRAAAELLGRLAERRRAWISALAAAAPIQRHGLLSDQRAAAVVDPRGSVAWLCVPRLDSPALFAELLGGPAAGSFAISPAAAATDPAQAMPKQRYVGNTMILETAWPGLTVTDYMDCSAGRPYGRAGRTDLVRVITGTSRATIRFAPRLDFGRVSTRLQVHEEGLVVEGHPDPIVLHAPGIRWTITSEARGAGAGPHETATAEVDPAGGPIVLTLRYGAANLREPVTAESSQRTQTERFWSVWAGTLKVPTLAREAVVRSALALKALCYGPTGAIAAAGTTSLPEWPGGIRNWDYRYCWPRDACLAAGALTRLGNTGIAMKLLDWLVEVVESCDSPERLRPIYTVTGRELGPEAEIGELTGYRASRPVRVGNAAAQQVQLDVFGPIVDLVWLVAERGAAVSPEHRRLVEAMVTAVQRRWREPDHGIWEIRHSRRHHVHSRVMCWLAVDRGIRLLERTMGGAPAEWAGLRDEIAADVGRHGWNASASAFTTAYGVPDLDAATLHVGLSGMLPPDDDRFVRTVEAVERNLRRGAAVFRYLGDDGLPGREGGFLICTGWLVESLALIGRVNEAKSLFESLLNLAGPTGLMAEQFDPDQGEALGNFPQAYSHLAVINAAVALSKVEPGA